MQRYNPKDIEPKWQKHWDDKGTYKTDLKSSKPKYVAMSMFNYPSGAGIHIGHAMNYTISDVKARFKRQQGFESYHPIGWDSFGLPAENYAIKAGVSPQKSMANIIPSYHKQYKAMGWSNDWSKEIATHTPEYYKWTQWIFSQMFKKRLAYQDSRKQWWCESCQTVLANEQVVDGRCWRHDDKTDPEVQKKEIKQWFFKITEYADELLDGIDDLDWTDTVKLAQKNWIGRSNGAEVDFDVADSRHKIKVFTTRPDTLFGATFMVLAPEHVLVSELTNKEQSEAVAEYIKQAQTKSDLDRQTASDKNKTGVFTGSYAVNPVSGEKIPVWIADYVLMGYGTGAIMAVPAHDERDEAFAKKYDLKITQVIKKTVNLTGKNAIQEGAKTLERDVVDAIIVDQDGNYLLIDEGDNVHFVGGGVDEDDANGESAMRREVIEEVGFNDIESITKVSSLVASSGYRITKKSNQLSDGYFYEVKLKSHKQVKSEIEDGRHSIKWVAKKDVAKNLTWEGHSYGWQQYLAGSTCESGLGTLINSGKYNGLPSKQAGNRIVSDLENKGAAKPTINYKMRDWSVSRQRYWGAPIPVINCDDCGTVLVPDRQLPVVLPELKDFQPSGDGRSALARAKDWVNVACPNCHKPAKRETDTLDTYICSSWYMYRYFAPNEERRIFDSKIVNKWAPIDFYNGGDHATAHLLYARFMARFFSKIGLVKNPEPFKQMLFNGKVMAKDGSAFSKSKGNGVDPLEIIDQGYGADALRTYLMFAAPLEFSARWDEQGVPGTHRFLSRIWTLTQEYLNTEKIELTKDQQDSIQRAVHPMIKKITEDIENNRYNTAIAAAMAGVNDLYKLKVDMLGKHDVWQSALESLLACIAPFAPHIADELWSQLGHEDSVQADSWPKWDESYLTSDTITIVVQINGKVRAELQVSADSTEDKIVKLAKENERVIEHLDGKNLKKTIYVPNKLVSFVV